MAHITISPPLRRFCKERRTLEGRGETLLAILSDAVKDYPELKTKILKNDEEISSQILIYRNNTTPVTADREITRISPNEELKIFTFVGGG